MLDESIINTIRSLINQRRDDLYSEKKESQKKLQSKFAGSGWSRPPGAFFVELSKLHEELILKMGTIILDSVIEVLDAYNPSYHQKLADEIKQEISIYLSKGLAEPGDYRCIGWSDPPRRNKEEERFHLETLVHFSLCKINTQIDLYVAKIKSREIKNMQEKPIIIHAANNSGIINSGANSSLSNNIKNSDENIKIKAQSSTISSEQFTDKIVNQNKKITTTTYAEDDVSGNNIAKGNAIAGISKFKSKTILIAAANPEDRALLRLDIEMRGIEESLQLAKHRGQFTLERTLATRVRDLHRAMQILNPTIVHFCGHGADEQGIILEDINGNAQLVSTEALANFFKLFADKVDCVILNACFSESQAKAIVQHIPYVIGMSESISDKAAIEFSVGFYGSLASGDDYERAYEFGRSAIEMAGIYGHSIPQFFKKTEQKTTEKHNKSLDNDKINSLKLPCEVENIVVEDMAQKYNESPDDDEINILKLLYKVENMAVEDMVQKLNIDIQQINYHSIELQSLKMVKAVNVPRQKIMATLITNYSVSGYQIEQKGRKYIIENQLNLT